MWRAFHVADALRVGDSLRVVKPFETLYELTSWNTCEARSARTAGQSPPGEQSPTSSVLAIVATRAAPTEAGRAIPADTTASATRQTRIRSNPFTKWRFSRIPAENASGNRPAVPMAG